MTHLFIRMQVANLEGPITAERVTKLIGRGNNYHTRRAATDLIDSLRSDKLLIERDGQLYGVGYTCVPPMVQETFRLVQEPEQPVIANVNNMYISKCQHGTVVKFKRGLGLPVTKTLATVYQDTPTSSTVRLFNGTWLEGILTHQIIPIVADAWNTAKQRAYEQELNRIQVINQRLIKRYQRKVSQSQTV